MAEGWTYLQIELDADLGLDEAEDLDDDSEVLTVVPAELITPEVRARLESDDELDVIDLINDFARSGWEVATDTGPADARRVLMRKALA